MRSILIPALAALPAAFSLHAAEVSPGNWEIHVTTSLGGASPPPVTQTRCLRAEDAKNLEQLFGKPGSGCEFLNQRDDGQLYSFDLLCKDQNVTVTGSGEVRYRKEDMEGDLKLRTVVSTQTLDLRTRIKARRLGPCK